MAADGSLFGNLRQLRVVDLFAGLGGWSEGARQAGCRVLWAANHWPLAVEYHARAHPDTIHACQDLQQADWRAVPAHDLLLASPACQGHSRARGAERPHHDVSRSTAWAVVSAAEYHRPALIAVENVPDFARWALYPVWREALARLGYGLAEHLVDAADLGAAQSRPRLFVVGALGRVPRLDLPQRAPAPASTLIEWDRYRWSPVDKPGRAEATLERIERARIDVGPRFLAPYYGSGSGLTGRSLDRPLGTVTTLDRWALVDGDRMRMLQPSELRAAQGFPITTELPRDRRTAIHLLGNAVHVTAAREVVTALLADEAGARGPR